MTFHFSVRLSASSIGMAHFSMSSLPSSYTLLGVNADDLTDEKFTAGEIDRGEQLHSRARDTRGSWEHRKLSLNDLKMVTCRFGPETRPT